MYRYSVSKRKYNKKSDYWKKFDKPNSPAIPIVPENQVPPIFAGESYYSETTNASVILQQSNANRNEPEQSRTNRRSNTKAKAQIYVLNKEEGGRHTPFFKGYRPQFFFGTADVTGIVELPEGVEMVMPGDNLTVEIELQKAIAMESGQRFAIREGGRTIGAGNISEIV